VAGSANFDVWNSCCAVFLNISMAKGTVQFGHFLMMNMIEADGLVDGDLRKNREDRVKDAKSLRPESIIGDSGKEKE
jgi:hypothetical protein